MKIFRHVYIRVLPDGSLARGEVIPGWPHGDQWGRAIDPTAPYSHDTERHRKMLAELEKKKKAKK